MLRMADSIDPASLPAGMDAYAGYNDGRWPDYQAIAAAHPGSHLLDFSVFLKDPGTGGDFEPGDMDPSQVVAYVQGEHARGVARPVVYASIASEMPACVANLSAAGIAWPAGYRRLSAHYGAGQHICGPSTCGYATQCDGTQWIDHATDLHQNWDESLLNDNFFDTASPIGGDMLTFRPNNAYRCDLGYVFAGNLWHAWSPDGMGSFASGQAALENWGAPQGREVIEVVGFSWDQEGVGLNAFVLCDDGLVYGQWWDITGKGSGWSQSHWNNGGTPTTIAAQAGTAGPKGDPGPAGDPNPALKAALAAAAASVGA